MLKVEGTVRVSLRNAVRDECHAVFRHGGAAADNKTGRSKVRDEWVVFGS